MMMNGDLMQTALSCKPGSFLGDVIEQARRQGRSPESSWWIPSTWRPSVDTRRPKSSRRREHYLAAFPDSLQVLQDLFWALLNSNEFVLNH